MQLSVKNLSKKFDHKLVVNNIDLTINEGDLVAFLGPNGAGKSTTINMLTGLIPQTSGEIAIDDLKPTDTKYHQQIGVVFQKSVLDDDLTVKQNLQSRYGMYRNHTNNLRKWIKLFQLEPLMNQKYKTLSGGQKRCVDIARALIHNPKILFLDEPTTGLDIQTRSLIWDVLNQLRKNQNLTIILTTHYLEEAELANFVYVIDHGQIIAADTVNNLKQDFAQNVLTLQLDSKNDLPQQVKNFQYQINADDVSVFIPTKNDAINLLDSLKQEIQGFEYRRGNMDDIFLKLTGNRGNSK
ncbi:ABC transporter ATP-binding protein [Companilactobacillus sp.]|jgi:multidrug/hemolysin transport system ATP-binding protein|uniref:ABC transporter ATP-binding protein n=1 Tax=Companilactobacillus sp. TaxID=2767905 RepID=UPI0025B7E007|nr:ABC transporter ATP-binding protein [Companilactobacillus sp.]MCH4009420.1 ABC transporter ATP-binding protein [Companilactobacillus sp.]MCH4050401.1 ABC transporter ATP-binding protein [Companilactobacillus sp.]MCH4077362.1 ABC transporter ATP-binding protein [Companilactobacillus sp.]MCH4125938.1 ABC transporter ATP-binding protein [Companilactobacillus sp.]MCI1311647.1 ABC transporter ATP-binding protein [Companilactobacillus sp.]